MKLTLLDINQIIGDNKLEIFKEPFNENNWYTIEYKTSGINKSSTDFADFTSIYPNELKKEFYSELKSMNCIRPELYFPESPWFTKSSENNKIRFINSKRSDNFDNYIDLKNIVFAHTIGIRPVIKYSDISSKVKNKELNPFGIYEVEYGEYPNNYITNELNNKLNELYSINALKITGKTYTTYHIDNNKQIVEKKYIEYVYNNKKYVKCDNKWLEVKPIVWLVDEKNNIAIPKYSIVSGIPFDLSEKYGGKFENTFMYKYLNNILIKEIKPSKKIIKDIDIVKLDKAKEEYIKTREEYLCNKNNSTYKQYIKTRENYYNLLIKSAEQLKSEKNDKSLVKSL